MISVNKSILDTVTVVLGPRWGYEGKSKLVGVLCAVVDVSARCTGGNNAGHTIVVPRRTDRWCQQDVCISFLLSGK